MKAGEPKTQGISKAEPEGIGGIAKEKRLGRRQMSKKKGKDSAAQRGLLAFMTAV